MLFLFFMPEGSRKEAQDFMIIKPVILIIGSSDWSCHACSQELYSLRTSSAGKDDHLLLRFTVLQTAFLKGLTLQGIHRIDDACGKQDRYMILFGAGPILLNN